MNSSKDGGPGEFGMEDRTKINNRSKYGFRKGLIKKSEKAM